MGFLQQPLDWKTCCGHYSLSRGGARVVAIEATSAIITGLVPVIPTMEGETPFRREMAGTRPAMT
jgi:hypothetical protein